MSKEEKSIKFPVDVITQQDKIEFLYVAQETLRLEHNAIGQDFRDGKITRQVFNAYVRNQFEPLQHRISRELGEQKESLKKSSRWMPDLKSL